MPPLSPLGALVTFIRSALFALLFYPFTVLLLVAAMIARPLGHRGMAPLAKLWAHGHWLLLRVVLGQRVMVEGALPADARFVVCKHESMFETIDALRLFHRPVIAAKRELAQLPLWGAAATAYGLIVVDRKGGASTLRAIRAEARAAFAADRPVILYPEGTRVPHGEAPALKSGFAGLYSDLECDVVPLAVDSGRLSPRNSFMKRAGIITYRFGEPIPPGLPRAQAEARVHAAINALNARDSG